MKYTNILNSNDFFIAPLLLSQNASFDFNNLKDSCKSLQPDNSSNFFTEVLNKIHSSKETQNIKEVSYSLVICSIFLIIIIATYIYMKFGYFVIKISIFVSLIIVISLI